jgi:predicted nucleic acid-binding protein
MLVADTDILIWILRQDHALVERFKNAVRETNGHIFITPVQVAEIYSGIRPKEKVRVETFIESLNILDIDKRMGKLAGEFLHDYGKSHLVTMADALVGAAAKVNVFKLWTMNRKHYPMFEANEFFE